jgi:hypothetical protein
MQVDSELEAIGREYLTVRASMMNARKEGMTSLYKRFHDSCDHGDIMRLRSLHADLDRRVLKAYGWSDLAQSAEAIFLNNVDESEFAYYGRLFWPSNIRDTVISRLLKLNREYYQQQH